MVATGKKITIPLFILVFYITISTFIAPHLLEGGTVVCLDGNANMVDHANRWDDLPLFSSIVYYFGDFNCHQKEDRSFHLNHNQMPMCARCEGIFVGLSAGMALMLISPARMFGSMAILSLLPRPLRNVVKKGDARIRRHFDVQLSPVLGAISVVLALSMVFDGLIQAFSSYESTNPVRLVTGFLFGLVVSLWFSAFIHGALYKPTLSPVYVPALLDSKVACNGTGNDGVAGGDGGGGNDGVAGGDGGDGGDGNDGGDENDN